MKNIIPLSLIFIFATLSANAAEKIIFDHDGGVDDFVSMTLLSCDKTYNIKAITVVPADSYKKPAISVTKKLSDLYGLKNVQISGSDFEGTNPFPDVWREHSDLMHEMDHIKNAKHNKTNTVLSASSHKHLVKLLSKNEQYVILATGPLSNIAEALRINPKIKKNIKRIYFMGGAINTDGNVHEEVHDGSAEWNIYNNPKAADIVLKSGIPMTWIPLDATQYVPLNEEFMSRLESQKSKASKMAYRLNKLLQKYQDANTVYFWDTLTTAVAIDPTLLQTQKVKLKVITEGESQGRTIESEEGVEVDVAFEVDQEKFENLLLDKLEACTIN